MAATKYTFSIQDDFPNHKVDSVRLTREIQQSSIVTALDYINTSGDECDVWFKAELSEEDEEVLEAIVAAHSGEPLPSAAQPVTLEGVAEDDDNRFRVSPEPRKTGSGLVAVTHNWCDPTTWYTESERVTDEELSDTGDGLTFDSVHEDWIDLVHGKVYREDLISAPYLPVVKVDGVEKTARAPWADSGGDYEIDYASGQVTFFESQ